MAIGDAATAAGIPLVSPTTDEVRDGADHHNETRDIIAARTSAVLAIAKGGTGAETAAQARTNLGLTEAATMAVAPPDNSLPGGLPRYNNTRQLTTADPTLAGHAASLNWVQWYVGSRGFAVSGAGDFSTGNGRLHSQGSRGWTVTTNYASAYLNADGWLGISPSALRFKTDVGRHDFTLEQAVALAECVATYRLLEAVYELGDDAPGEVGVIAEWLLAAGLEAFVIKDDEGQPLSVAYDRLVTVALGGVRELAQRVVELELGVEQLLERVSKLEAGA